MEMMSSSLSRLPMPPVAYLGLVHSGPANGLAERLDILAVCDGFGSAA